MHCSRVGAARRRALRRQPDPAAVAAAAGPGHKRSDRGYPCENDHGTALVHQDIEGVLPTVGTAFHQLFQSLGRGIFLSVRPMAHGEIAAAV